MNFVFCILFGHFFTEADEACQTYCNDNPLLYEDEYLITYEAAKDLINYKKSGAPPGPDPTITRANTITCVFVGDRAPGGGGGGITYSRS